MKTKLVLIIILVLIVVVVGYFVFVRRTIQYFTKEDCEKKTGKQCQIFKSLCQVSMPSNQEEAKENEEFLRECLSKNGTWQPI